MYYVQYLAHHGVKDQKWGVVHGPPYPIRRDSSGRPLKTREHISAKQAYAEQDRKKAKVDPKTGIPLKSKEYTPFEEIKYVNPGYDDPNVDRQDNCGNCAVAYDLRRRGFDVIASPVKDYDTIWSDSTYEYIYGKKFKEYQTWEEMPDSFMDVPEGYGKKVTDWAIPEILSQGEGARGFIVVDFAKDMSHILNYEVVNQNGQTTVLMFDGQTKKVHSMDHYYPVTVNFSYMRTDDAEPKYEIIQELSALYDGGMIEW